MALFTDGPASTIEDLAAQDSQLLNIASAEGVDLTVKLGLEQEAIGLEVEELLQRGSSFRLSQVVVTPALRLWHTYRTLELVYRDAYHSQLNDRYAGKRDQFRELSKWAYDRLIQAGIGIAVRPVPRAATPRVSQTTGQLSDGLYYVTMAWMNEAGECGACANPETITVAGGGFQVEPQAPSRGVTGWNVYAGFGPDAMWQQNVDPIAPDAPWMQIGLWLSNEVLANGGQSANYFHAIPRVLQRG